MLDFSISLNQALSIAKVHILGVFFGQKKRPHNCEALLNLRLNGLAGISAAPFDKITYVAFHQVLRRSYKVKVRCNSESSASLVSP